MYPSLLVISLFEEEYYGVAAQAGPSTPLWMRAERVRPARTAHSQSALTLSRHKPPALAPARVAGAAPRSNTGGPAHESNGTAHVAGALRAHPKRRRRPLKRPLPPHSIWRVTDLGGHQPAASPDQGMTVSADSVQCCGFGKHRILRARLFAQRTRLSRPAVTRRLCHHYSI